MLYLKESLVGTLAFASLALASVIEDRGVEVSMTTIKTTITSTDIIAVPTTINLDVATTGVMTIIPGALTMTFSKLPAYLYLETYTAKTSYVTKVSTLISKINVTPSTTAKASSATTSASTVAKITSATTSPVVSSASSSSSTKAPSSSTTSSSIPTTVSSSTSTAAKVTSTSTVKTTTTSPVVSSTSTAATASSTVNSLTGPYINHWDGTTFYQTPGSQCLYQANPATMSGSAFQSTDNPTCQTYCQGISQCQSYSWQPSTLTCTTYTNTFGGNVVGSTSSGVYFSDKYGNPGYGHLGTGCNNPSL